MFSNPKYESLIREFLADKVIMGLVKMAKPLDICKTIVVHLDLQPRDAADVTLDLIKQANQVQDSELAKYVGEGLGLSIQEPGGFPVPNIMKKQKKNENSENSMISRAKQFAIERHGQQKYGDLPYSVHLSEVVDVAERFSLPENIKVAAWLHDTLEDTNTQEHELANLFGQDIAKLVKAVTNEVGQNRSERNKQTYSKIRSLPNAVALKLCDRIANIEHSLKKNNSKMFKMYHKEYPEFRNTLFREGEFSKLWEHLDSLFKKNTLKELSPLRGEPEFTPGQIPPEKHREMPGEWPYDQATVRWSKVRGNTRRSGHQT